MTSIFNFTGCNSTFYVFDFAIGYLGLWVRNVSKKGSSSIIYQCFHRIFSTFLTMKFGGKTHGLCCTGFNRLLGKPDTLFLRFFSKEFTMCTVDFIPSTIDANPTELASSDITYPPGMMATLEVDKSFASCRFSKVFRIYSIF